MKTILRRLTLPNLVAVLVVTLVLGSGTAYAAKKITGKQIKDNSVSTKDITDGSLTGTDVADGSLSATDILDGTLTGVDVKDGSLTGADVQDGSIGSADITDGTVTSGDVANNSLTSDDLAGNSVNFDEIATDAVQATEIQDDSIDSGEIIDFGLSNQDVGVLFAQVSAAGALNNSSGNTGGTVTATKLAGTGAYEVSFGRNVSNCAFTGTVGAFDTSGASGFLRVADRAADANAVFVSTFDVAGAAADRPFQLVVVC